MSTSGADSSTQFLGPDTNPVTHLSVAGGRCESSVSALQRAGLPHYSVAAIVVDYYIDNNNHSNRHDDNIRSSRDSLAALRAVDLLFLRPRLVLVRVAHGDCDAAEALLMTHGYTTGRESTPESESYVWGTQLNTLELPP